MVKTMLWNCGNFVEALHRPGSVGAVLDVARERLSILYKIATAVSNETQKADSLSMLIQLYRSAGQEPVAVCTA